MSLPPSPPPGPEKLGAPKNGPAPVLMELSLRECSGDMGGDLALKAGNSCSSILPKGSLLSIIATWLGEAACRCTPTCIFSHAGYRVLAQRHYGAFNLTGNLEGAAAHDVELWKMNVHCGALRRLLGTQLESLLGVIYICSLLTLNTPSPYSNTESHSNARGR